MIDTIKVGIPLSPAQHKRVYEVAKSVDRWQWVQINPVLGELRFVKISGLLKADQHSYHRELRWDVDPIWSEQSQVILEFSLPKYWYGHNIHLLHDFQKALYGIKTGLEQLFGLKTRSKLPDPKTWNLYRVDLCYAWRFPNQAVAQEYLDSLKHLRYPRKRPIVYPTSIVFQGTTYTLKFYLKQPEFKVHDRKELLKSSASLEWINHLEALSDGVLRTEATLRRQYLKVKGLLTVADLLTPVKRVHWDEAVYNTEGFDPSLAMTIVFQRWQEISGIDLEQNIESGIETPLADGMYFSCPPVTIHCDLLDITYHHPGGGFTYREHSRLITLIQFFLEKFLGKETAMQEANQVETKLLEVYKPVKAARLVSVWLYVQRFGSDKARELFGKDSFNRSKRELKAAGISFIEHDKFVTDIDSEFLKNFRLSVPSPHVTNKEDDFRDSGNILNFVPKVSSNF